MPKKPPPEEPEERRRRWRALEGRKAFEILSEDEVNARIRLARSQLRKLGAYEDTSRVPMAQLTDTQLDQRIAQVQGELDKLAESTKKGLFRKGEKGSQEPPVEDDGHISPAEREAVLRQLDMLDYLIEHPDATISPDGLLDVLDDELLGWSQAFLDGDDDAGPHEPPAPVG